MTRNPDLARETIETFPDHRAEHIFIKTEEETLRG